MLLEAVSQRCIQKILACSIRRLFSAASLALSTETLGKRFVCGTALDQLLPSSGLLVFLGGMLELNPWATGSGASVPFCTMTFLCCPHSWRAPRYILAMSEARHDRVRKKYHILVEGEGIPPPIKSFKEMKFPAGGLGEAPDRAGGSFVLGNAHQ